MIKRMFILLIVTVGWPTFLIGCGGAGGPRPPMGKVAGVVTYNGSPLTAGSVLFTPAQGKGADSGHVAAGQLDGSGRFNLTTFNTGDGAVLGQHVVTIQTRKSTNSGPPTPGPDGTITINYQLAEGTVPSKYENAETSPLRYTVEPGRNNFEIELEED